MGWPVEPDGLTELLVRLHDEYTDVSIYITENGRAVYDYVDPEGEVKDEERIAYLDAHFRAAHEAMQQGVGLRGYLVWSLLDNFEWALGYSKRFGLIFVDYGTQRRIPKASARWYREVIERNGLPDDKVEVLQLAASELATNSVRHGGGTGTVAMWTTPSAAIVEFHDAGRLTDPLTGRLMPSLDQEGGRGVFLVNQLCDLVQLRSSDEGTTIRITTWL